MKRFLPSIFAFISASALLIGQEAPEETTFRPLPLKELPVLRTILVSDFGAIPNDDKNDLPAIEKAVAAAVRAGKGTLLKFDKGNYDLIQADKTKKFLIYLNSSEGLTIDGSGAHFTVRSPRCGFMDLRACKDTIIKNMTVDYDPIPWTEGEIVAVDIPGNSVDVKIRETAPKPEAPNFIETDFCYLIDPQVPGRLKAGVPNHCYSKKITKLSEGVYRFSLKYKIPSPDTYEIGDRFVYLARTGCGGLFGITHCDNVSFINITSYASPAGHYAGALSSQINVLGCKALIKEGRWKGGNADFLHLQQNRVGPWMEGCVIEGISDDSSVIYTRPLFVKDLSSDNIVKFVKAVKFDGSKYMPLSKGEVREGDVLGFLDTDKGEYIAEATVEKILGKGEFKLKNITPDDADIRVLGEGKIPLQVFNLNITRNFVIKDNVYRNSRRYGIYWKGSYGVISGNTFEGLSNEAISIHNESRAPNGPTCRNLYIVSNKIKDCGFESGYRNKYSAASISVHSDSTSYGTTDSESSHRNILIKDNYIEGWNGRAIYARNVENLILSGNKVGSPSPKFAPKADPVKVEYCSNVKQN